MHEHAKLKAARQSANLDTIIAVKKTYDCPVDAATATFTFNKPGSEVKIDLCRIKFDDEVPLAVAAREAVNETEAQLSSPSPQAP